MSLLFAGDLLEEKTAIFSDDRVYRYQLTRRWTSGTLTANFIMLNPSTADESKNDPTVERCERRVRMWGFNALIVTNIFAFCSTDPAVLSTLDDPVGTDNDKAIIQTAEASSLIVCGWGKDGVLKGRGKFVREMLRDRGLTLNYLRMGRNGQPWHPLYVPYSQGPVVWS